MDEELIELTTDETVALELEEVVEIEATTDETEYSVEQEEDIETVEIALVEEIEVEMNEAVGWTGGDSTRHYSLYGRDEPNQHPITAITGLRDELDEIKALKTVYSDKSGFANYYEWDEGAYDEYGHLTDCSD